MIFYKSKLNNKKSKIYSENILFQTEDITNKLAEIKQSLEIDDTSSVYLDTEYVADIILSKDNLTPKPETSSIFEPKPLKNNTKKYSPRIIPIISSSKIKQNKPEIVSIISSNKK